MLQFVRGNLLESKAEALVNTVNTVGVMGKGIALMFKEAFPDNYRAYRRACKRGEVNTGKMFVTQGPAIAGGPRWIINFPTKKHWKTKTKLEWVERGLEDLVIVLRELDIASVAVPPLGCGNGGLDWRDVKPMIEARLAALEGVEVSVFEPTSTYQNASKLTGVDELTPARALIAELIRRYWILGIGCSLLEVQKLAWFLEREIEADGLRSPLDLKFSADRYGPYADRLRHLLELLDGSYLRSERRMGDARPLDSIAFNDAARERVANYLAAEARDYLPALERVTSTIDGFESPLGLELLATIDWLLVEDGIEPTPRAMRAALKNWRGDSSAGARKSRIITDTMLAVALARLRPNALHEVEPVN